MCGIFLATRNQKTQYLPGIYCEYSKVSGNSLHTPLKLNLLKKKTKENQLFANSYVQGSLQSYHHFILL